MRGAVLATILVAGASSAQAPPPDEAPKQLGLTERAHSNLAQFEVALTGPRERISGLTAADFDVTIAGKTVKPVAIDPMCPASPAPSAVAGSRGEAVPVPVAAAPASYLFYFDQRNLTIGGRTTSLQAADGLIRKLIRNGNRGSIVSSGKRLTTLAPFTDDPETLLLALGRIPSDLGQWDDYASQEWLRVRNVKDLIRHGQPHEACALARTYRREEYARARQALELLGATLGRFSSLPAPKRVVYFGDTLRDRPGRHYGSYGCDDPSSEDLDPQLSFRGIHDAAAAYGVTVYGVEAEGIQVPSMALYDSQGGLKTLALDTGGDAFLNGASVDSMAGTIDADQACVYLVSFDPSPFPTDGPLGIDVRVNIPGVRARTRAHLVIQSESAHRTSILLGAFTAPDDVKDGVKIHGGIVPIDVLDGRLRFLAQAVLPETELRQGETWDVGMSLVSRSDVPHQTSQRVTVDQAGVKLLLESEMEVESGPFEIALAAVEGVTGRIAAGRLTETWTGKVGPSRIVAIAVLQPTEGAFVRDGSVRKAGSLVVPPGDPVRAELPTAFVTLVCRTGKRQRIARVQRTLTGGADTTFPPLELSFAEAACVQVRDVMAAGTLGPGPATYTITVEGAESGESRAFKVK